MSGGLVCVGRAAAAAVAVIAVVALPVGAQVLTTVAVVEPGNGAAVSTPGVVVEVQGVGEAESVQARMVVGAQNRVQDLSGPEPIPAGSRWTGSLDLAGLPNGAARVEARATLAGSDGPTEWQGHEVRLDFPAPAVALTVGLVQADAVALSWTAAEVPDVSAYEVHRALAEGGYEPLVTVDGGQLAHTDVEVPAGDHRYRVRAVRPGEGGAPRPGPWAEGAVGVGQADAGAPPPEEGGDGSAPTSGVAAAPRTGGISARLRAGTEDMAPPETPSLGPQVAPQDPGYGDQFPAGPSAASPSEEELAQGGDSRLAVSRRDDGPVGSDAVRLVGLGLAGLLAVRARWITGPRRRRRSAALTAQSLR